MFTGLVEEVGKVVSIRNIGGKRRLTVAAKNLTRELKTGDSIAVSGVCLTAVETGSDHFGADLAEETWVRTSFSRITEGALVNLELPMKVDGRLGGHMVQGHVDGTGKFLGLEKIQGADDFWLHIEIPEDLERYVVFKGSISIEGISLTVAKIEGNQVTDCDYSAYLRDDKPAIVEAGRSDQSGDRHHCEIRGEDDGRGPRGRRDIAREVSGAGILEIGNWVIW